MTVEELQLLAHEEGRYQDIFLGDEKIVSGWRDCEERWELIKPHVHPQTTIMDIGSHYGYFAIRAAQQPDTLVWSFESQEKRSDIQAAALGLNGLRNVILSPKHLQLKDFERMARTTEKVDLVLALSVLHYFEPDELPEILYALGRISQNVIVEIANPNESEVANKDWVKKVPIRYLLGTIFDSVTELGETPAPKDRSVMRKMYLCQNYSIERSKLIGYPQAIGGRMHRMSYKDSAWKINGKKMHNGLNLYGLSYYGIKYPSVASLAHDAGVHYYHLILKRKGNVTDVHPRNVLVTHNGQMVIDYQEGLGTDIYGLKWEDYRKWLTEMSEELLVERIGQMINEQGPFALFNHKGRDDFAAELEKELSQ